MAQAFPDGFRWGTATAAHQVEGGNTNNDWWEWEHREGSVCVESSGDACDQWHRYPEDLQIAADLGFDNYRMSVEWSRIEPAEGEFSNAALDHYRRVCGTARELGIEPVVTFHHFTTPIWASALQGGGWHDARIVDRFARFCERTVDALGDLIGRACTINEANVVAFVGYKLGLFPPGPGTDAEYHAALDNFIAAHRRSYDVIKAGRGDFPVGLTVSMADYQAVPHDDPASVAKRDEIRGESEDIFLESCRGDDFIGVQTYTRDRIGPNGTIGGEAGVPTLTMGYEYYPEALEATIRRAWEVTDHVPVLVTENGIGTADDEQRLAYVQTALAGVQSCLADGVDVLGYTYWSLLDNFEWAFGYGPRFGIVSVDRATQERTVKPSARWLSEVIRANALP